MFLYKGKTYALSTEWIEVIAKDWPNNDEPSEGAKRLLDEGIDEEIIWDYEHQMSKR